MRDEGKLQGGLEGDDLAEDFHLCAPGAGIQHGCGVLFQGENGVIFQMENPGHEGRVSLPEQGQLAVLHVLLAADEALCAGEGFRQGLTELLDRLAAAEALRKLQRERREVMADLRLAQKALRERQGEDLRSLCCHTREQLDRLQALDAEIAALSAAS